MLDQSIALTVTGLPVVSQTVDPGVKDEDPTGVVKLMPAKLGTELNDPLSVGVIEDGARSTSLDVPTGVSNEMPKPKLLFPPAMFPML